MKPEQALIKELQKGKQSALADIIDQYSGYVSAIIRRMIGGYLPNEDIEEAAADVFVSLWRSRDNLRGEHGLKPYLAAIARNKAKDKLRGQRLQECPLNEDLIVADNDFQKHIETAEQTEIIEAALELMDVEDRMIFLRYYYFFEKITEIAQALSMNESTIKSRLFRGRKHLRQILTERGYACEGEYF